MQKKLVCVIIYNMMMVSGISILPERVPAVVVPPIVMAHIDKTAVKTINLLPLQPYAATKFKLHRNPFDRSLQDTYDIHGKMVRDHQTTGSQLNTLI